MPHPRSSNESPVSPKPASAPTPLAAVDLQPTLEGDLVLLRPLREHDFEALHAAANDPLIWEQHPQHDRWRREVFRTYFDGGIASRGAFAVIERATGRIIGSTRFHGLDPGKREVEIGWTFLTRAHWGGRFNHEMKRLLLDHAFRFVDRVLFLVGPNNIRSQTAVERIGGVRSGTRRDDTGLESVVFVIDAAAWRARRADS
ncbi:MAG: GNAT family N-acetyltransferase [Phycisphaerae bacterium]|nr:GNAT family N-acetyltransferase [Phycisphaerae bacterium]